MRLAIAALAAMLLGGTGRLDAGLAEERDVLELFAELPMPFAVEAAETGERGRVFRLRSADPIGRTTSGALYLRATVTLSSADDDAAAEEEVTRRLAAADRDTGLSYAWDYVAAGGRTIAHLHAGCTFSEESFHIVARALAQELDPGGDDPPVSFWCRCGGACRTGSPFSEAAAPEPVRLPPVRRSEGVEEGEYDNRLDPSGAWSGPIGDLSLMHHANRVAFSYVAVFGATAHICEGAGVAGLVGRDRYEWVDEQGSVTFILTETSVRMEPTAGIASFCGAGWPGERFTTEAFRPPTACRVAVEHTHFHVVDTLDRERTFASVGQGSAVEIAPAPHTGDEAWGLGRYAGPLSTRLGLLARGDLTCPGGPR